MTYVAAVHTPALTRTYAWFSALINEDTELMDDLLAHGVPVDVQHPLRHSTALMEATRRGRTDMVQWLLAHGAAPAFLCGLPLGSPIHCALRLQHWAIGGMLLDALTSVTVIDAYGRTPLHLLCMETYDSDLEPTLLDLATALIQRHCPLNAMDDEGTTALHHCTINDHAEIAEHLLSAGANPNMVIPQSLVAPLTIAALEKNITMAMILLKYGADPYLKTRDGSCPATILPNLLQLEKELHHEIASPVRSERDAARRARHNNA